MINKTYILLLSSVLLFGCKNLKKNSAVSDDNSEKTAFYTIAVKHDSIKGRNNFKIKNTTVVNSVIKFDNGINNSKNVNFLKIEITYTQNKIITVFTEHPLHRRFDLYSETGEIASKVVILPEAETTIRVPYYGVPKKIMLFETINNKLLTKTELKP